MNYKTIHAGSVLKKITRTDDLFNGNYTVDPYQNCEIGCVYCDSSFEKTIYIKNNSQELLKKELKNEKKGRIIIGSVHDPYQPIEKDKKHTRELLKTIKESDFSCNILTKSELVLRDLDVIKEMNDCIVTISISSLNKDITNVFEKNVVDSNIRLEIIKKLISNNVDCGIAVIPFLPYLMDDELENIVEKVSFTGSNFILLKTLELRGDLKTCVFEKIKTFFPEYFDSYISLYEDSFLAEKNYTDKVFKNFQNYCSKYRIDSEIKK